MYVDTHCHLNFKAFRGIEGEVIKRAEEIEVKRFIVPGTDVKTSRQAVLLAEKYTNVYAAVGLHPHHALEDENNDKIQNSNPQIDKSNSKFQIQNGNQERLEVIENLLKHPKVVAVGEVGLDRYEYQNTKYENYVVTEEFVAAQKEVLLAQFELAVKYKKALILHNRQAVGDLLPLLSANWDKSLERRAVFHCCEANEELLSFAQAHKMFIGVDGDLSWSKKKQRFIKEVPLKILVLETDSPYLLPKTDRNNPSSVKDEIALIQTQKHNEPTSIPLIAQMVAAVKGISVEEVEKATTANAQQLFDLIS